MTPTVSVCIPAYGQPQALYRALRSVFAQSFNSFQVVVTDDTQDDSVRNVVSGFANQGDLIYQKNEVRKGTPQNWNEAVRLASGDYIKLLHHDDWLKDENSLAEFVGLLERHKDASFGFCSSVAYDSAEKPVFVHTPSDSQIRSLRADPATLFFGNFVGSPSATIMRATVKEEYDANLKWLVDVEYYMRVLQRGVVFAFNPSPLVCVTTLSPFQVTAEVSGDRVVQVYEWLYLYSKVAGTGPIDYRRVKFMSELLRRWEIRSQSDLVDCGVDFHYPEDIDDILRIHSHCLGAGRHFLGLRLIASVVRKKARWRAQRKKSSRGT